MALGPMACMVTDPAHSRVSELMSAPAAPGEMKYDEVAELSLVVSTSATPYPDIWPWEA